MEKCPPAEACRDAFERMSNATVTMCLSTNGFGGSTSSTSNRLVALAEKPHRADSDHLENPPAKDNDPDDSESNVDRDIDKEHPTDTKHNIPDHRPSLHQARPAEYHNGYVPLDQTEQLSPAQPHVISHTSPFTSIQQPTYINVTSTHSQGPQYPCSEPFTTHPPYSAVPITTHPNLPDQDFRYLPEFDFLNLVPHLNPEQLYGASTGADSAAGTNAPQMGMFSMPSSFGIGGDPSDTGFELGFGMNLGLQNDWSETSNYDLFGGFYFGNGAGGT